MAINCAKESDEELLLSSAQQRQIRAQRAARQPAELSLSLLSPVRGTILSFLPLQSLRHAVLIHDGWFNAASTSPKVWDTAVELHYAHKANTIPILSSWYPLVSMPFRFSNACIFPRVLDAVAQYSSTIQSLLDDDEFFKCVGTYFGSFDNRFVFQFPVLLLLLHIPAFLYSKVDSTSREGYLEKRRFLLLIANVVRWHDAYPSVGHIPWLIELYRWGAYYFPASLPFDVILLTPALSALTNSHRSRASLTESQLVDIVRITERYCARFLAPHTLVNTAKTTASSTASGGSAPKAGTLVFRSPTSQGTAAFPTATSGGESPSVSLSSASLDTREIFRVLVLVLERYRNLQRVRSAVALVLQEYGPAGVEEMIQCKMRVDTFRVMKHVVAAEDGR